jgi:hypothetical protein
MTAPEIIGKRPSRSDRLERFIEGLVFGVPTDGRGEGSFVVLDVVKPSDTQQGQGVPGNE